MRKGFSLLTAIIFLVLIATISAISISLSTQSVKQTSDMYLKAQAQLLLRSGTEFAMLALSGHNYSTNCLEKIDMTYNNMLDINVSIDYIGSGLPCNSSHILDNNISTDDSNRTVIIDTIVTTKPDVATEPIRLHRRTIQKP
ncbi:MAG: type II secretion system protein [Sulfurospirillum sp.]